MSASPRLVIDYGSVGTVAVLAWPDGQWTALRFDDQHVLPSAVHTSPEGRIVTGHQAWRLADDTSGTFTESPLRTGTTADPAAREPAQALTAATLRRVTDEAARIAGEPVNEVRLVIPAGWGPRRRTWLRGAAAQAGITQPILIAAPVAVAGLLPTLGVPVPDDAVLLIMDLGSGCEATVLRCTSNGFNVSSTVHDPDAGGGAIDKLLLTHINQLTAPAPPSTTTAAVHGSVLSPDTTAPAGQDERRWALLAGVRAGKEALTYRATASVGLPPPAPAAIITTDTVRHAAHPVLHRAAALAQQAVAAADIEADDLYGVYCIGAAAATPGVAEAITDRLGIIPALLPDPATIAALGAAAATPDGEPPATTPPARGALARATAVIVPAAASLTLLTQFLLTTTSADRNPVTDPVNWGELALATMFAVLACLAASRPLGTLLRQILIAQTPTPPVQPTPDSQLRYGTVLGATIGLALTGVYAVFAALYASLPLSSALRWAILPAACIAAASVTAVLATTHLRPDQQRVRVQTANLLKFPPGAIALTTAGMLLVQYTLTIPRPPDLAIYLDLGTRIGGLLIGIGVAFTLVKALLLRLVLALPWGLLAAVIASSTTTGILAAAFALAALCWCGYPLLNLLTATSAPRTPQHDPT